MSLLSRYHLQLSLFALGPVLMFRHLFWSTLLLANCVSAGIYGTYPVADTVLSAGRVANVEWTNDHSKPSLTDMGPVNIDLYVGEVATLHWS